MTPQLISGYTATTCLGHGLAATLAALRAGRSGLQPCAFETVRLDTWIGEVAGVDDQRCPRRSPPTTAATTGWPLLALRADGFAERVRAAAARYGARPHRRLPRHQHLGHPADRAGLPPARPGDRRPAGRLPLPHARTTPSRVAEFTRATARAGRARPSRVSTACSSSAKVFAAAARMIDCGVIDAAVVGGVDTLCLTTLYGFNSLELRLARPLPALRRGAQRHLDRRGGGLRAARARTGQAGRRGAVLLLGVGESSDAYHMSSPHPEGARRAAGDGGRAALGAAWRRPTSTTSTCTARRRPATTRPRARPCARCSATACRAARPRARPATRWAPPAPSRRSSARWR